jgi:hypothetical protein
MADLRIPDNQEPEPVHSVAAARLVSGILDGTYESLENAQIALERSRQPVSKRKSEPVGSGDSELRN